MIRWIQAFIDRPADRFDEAIAFWTTITGTELSARRGLHHEFVTLLPPSGDPYLKMQAVGDSGGVHIDLDVDNVRATLPIALDLGATLIAEEGDGLAVLRSPQGQLCCLTAGNGHDIPVPLVAPGGVVSRLDQVCIDIAPSGYEAETKFWAALTGWTLHQGSLPEFSYLAPERPMPVRILLQRLTEERPAGAHLDLACSDYDALAAWHQSLGAREVQRGSHWIVMADPVGAPYCLTGRDPLTGRKEAS